MGEASPTSWLQVPLERGKTTTSYLLSETTQFCHINIGEWEKQKNLHDGWDEEFECYVVHEDLVCDELEDMMKEHGNIADLHNFDFFPK